MNIYEKMSVYEEKFEFPLWKLIKQRAKEKNISYSAASREVLPEYERNIRYREDEFAIPLVVQRGKELAKQEQREKLEESEDLWSFLGEEHNDFRTDC